VIYFLSLFLLFLYTLYYAIRIKTVSSELNDVFLFYVVDFYAQKYWALYSMLLTFMHKNIGHYFVVVKKCSLARKANFDCYYNCITH